MFVPSDPNESMEEFIAETKRRTESGLNSTPEALAAYQRMAEKLSKHGWKTQKSTPKTEQIQVSES